ncbi:MAG TPA: DNA-formamidopyrimidine glycosylase family protein [Gammaproteobacteria bacterium]|nr:DNA-formamidopyrimidine glycosylase family protein [Gammaproteobacteria bacterium]
MPELPDVECFRRSLTDLPGRRVRAVRVEAPAMLEGLEPARLAHGLEGRRFHDVTRRGKHLLVQLEGGGALALHFGLSGRPALLEPGQPAPRYTRLAIALDRGALVVADPRKLGHVALTDDVDEWLHEHDLGPDALALSAEDFATRLSDSRAGLKSLLMDQRALAGIGNIYSDEILFQARMHPARRARDLSGTQARRLYDCMHAVLETAIDSGAEPDRMPPGYLIHYRRKGARCPRCDTPLERLSFSGRHAWICPRCQPAP